MFGEHDVCWCHHTRAQHGIFGPSLCNFCTDCTGFRVEAMQPSAEDDDTDFVHRAILEDYEDVE